MTKLLVRATLPDLDESEPLTARYDFTRLEHRQRTHSGDANRLGPDELRFEMRLSVLEEHGDDLGEVGLLTLPCSRPGYARRESQEYGQRATPTPCPARPPLCLTAC